MPQQGHNKPQHQCELIQDQCGNQPPRKNQVALDSEVHEHTTQIIRLKMKHHKPSILIAELNKELSELRDELEKKTNENGVFQQELSETK